MEIREYKEEDCQEMAELFYNTVHSINIKDYSIEQVNAWATGQIDLNKKNKSFLENHTVVVIEDDKIIGFGDLASDGYLDNLFVHKYYQGKGVASLIMKSMEEYAISEGIDVLYSNVSITAKSFFENKAYKVIQEQEIERNGIKLKNYRMEKHI